MLSALEENITCYYWARSACGATTNETEYSVYE